MEIQRKFIKSGNEPNLTYRSNGHAKRNTEIVCQFTRLLVLQLGLKFFPLKICT